MMFYTVAKSVVSAIARMVFNIEYRGIKNIPTNEGYMLCSNHRTNWDAIIISHPVKQCIHYMGKREMFKNPIMGFIFKKLGVFPVDRGNGDKGALDYAVSLIKNNEILGIFPEGTRSKTSELLHPKSGAALIASRTKSNILPVGIKYEEPIRFRSRVKVTYGPIIQFEQLGIDEASPSKLKITSKLIINKIAECRQK